MQISGLVLDRTARSSEIQSSHKAKTRLSKIKFNGKGKQFESPKPMNCMSFSSDVSDIESVYRSSGTSLYPHFTFS